MTAPDAITVQVDEQPRTLPAGTTLAALVDALLAELGQAHQTVGTAVNGLFVPRGQRATRVLQAGDTVLLFRPIVGG